MSGGSLFSGIVSGLKDARQDQYNKARNALLDTIVQDAQRKEKFKKKKFKGLGIDPTHDPKASFWDRIVERFAGSGMIDESGALNGDGVPELDSSGVPTEVTPSSVSQRMALPMDLGEYGPPSPEEDPYTMYQAADGGRIPHYADKGYPTPEDLDAQLLREQALAAAAPRTEPGTNPINRAIATAVRNQATRPSWTDYNVPPGMNPPEARLERKRKALSYAESLDPDPTAKPVKATPGGARRYRNVGAGPTVDMVSPESGSRRMPAPTGAGTTPAAAPADPNAEMVKQIEMIPADKIPRITSQQWAEREQMAVEELMLNGASRLEAEMEVKNKLQQEKFDAFTALIKRAMMVASVNGDPDTIASLVTAAYEAVDNNQSLHVGKHNGHAIAVSVDENGKPQSGPVVLNAQMLGLLLKNVNSPGALAEFEQKTRLENSEINYRNTMGGVAEAGLGLEALKTRGALTKDLATARYYDRGGAGGTKDPMALKPMSEPERQSKKKEFYTDVQTLTMDHPELLASSGRLSNLMLKVYELTRDDAEAEAVKKAVLENPAALDVLESKIAPLYHQYLSRRTAIPVSPDDSAGQYDVTD